MPNLPARPGPQAEVEGQERMSQHPERIERVTDTYIAWGIERAQQHANQGDQ